MSDFENVRLLALKLSELGVSAGLGHFSDAEIAVAASNRKIFEIYESYISLKPKLGYCKFYAKNTGEGCRRPHCPRLHLCSYYVARCCHYGPSCRKCHDFHSDENEQILRQLEVHTLPEDALINFVQASKEYHFLPDVCNFYNTSGCRNGPSCNYLHICSSHVIGFCSASDCDNNHDVHESRCAELLRTHGVAVTEVEEKRILTGLQEKLLTRRRRGIGTASEFAGEGDDVCATRLIVDEICGFAWKGVCGYGYADCVRLHAKHVYHWQLGLNNLWFNLPMAASETLEEHYCNPTEVSCDVQIVDSEVGNKTGVSVETVPECARESGVWTCDFVSMKMTSPTGCFAPIRRLATASFRKGEYAAPFMSKYRWYFGVDEHDWREINDLDPYYSSDDVEHAFQRGLPKFLDVDLVTQTVERSGRVYELRRRPSFDFESEERVNTVPFPRTWTPVDRECDWLERVTIQPSSVEYVKAVRSLPSDWNVIGVERVQNPFLWQQYGMKLKTVKSVDRRVFHVADGNYVTAICQENFHENFDEYPSRDCKGLQFWATPELAHAAFHGTGDNGEHTADRIEQGVFMFVVRVLVGYHTLTVRVGAEEPYTVVDDVADPKSFLKFDSGDTYPEYIIRYKP